MKKYLFVILAATLFAACGDNKQSSPSDDEIQDTKEHPFFGKILDVYGEMVRDGKNYLEIKKEIGGIINDAKGRELPVKGSPYGIRTSKAVIIDWNVQESCLNIIVQFIPDDGTDFTSLMNPLNGHGVKELVKCNMMGTHGKITRRSAHRLINTNDLAVTMIIDNMGKCDYNVWKTLEYIKLTEAK